VDRLPDLFLGLALMWSLFIYRSTTLSIQHRGSPRSSRQAEVLVSRSRTSILQRRAFSVAGLQSGMGFLWHYA